MQYVRLRNRVKCLVMPSLHANSSNIHSTQQAVTVHVILLEEAVLHQKIVFFLQCLNSSLIN